MDVVIQNDPSRSIAHDNIFFTNAQKATEWEKILYEETSYLTRSNSASIQ